MALFGPSKKQKHFVKQEADSLANYIKNNAVKFGGEAYVRLQFPKDINKEVLWLFWVDVSSTNVWLGTIMFRPVAVENRISAAINELDELLTEKM